MASTPSRPDRPHPEIHSPAQPGRLSRGHLSHGHLSHGHLSNGTALLAALAAALTGIALGLRYFPDLAAGGLLNPDSAMRLVRLDDILAAGQPLHAVLRDSAGIPGGSVMSWSHLMDSLLLLLAAPLAPLLGWHGALHAAGLVWAPLCMAGLGVALAWAVAPVAPRALLWIAAVAAGASPAIVSYGMLGVVHHHVPLTIAVIMAAGCALRLLQDKPPLHAAIALGAWTAAGLWLSPEALPFALMATGALWIEWIRDPVRIRSLPLVTSGCTMALLATLAWLVDPPATGLWAIEPDRLSLPFILLCCGAAVAALAAQNASRLVTLPFAAALAIAWLAAFPHLLHGTEGLMTPEQAAAFFGPINEMQPVRGLDGALETLVGGMFALAALLVFAWNRRTEAAAALLLYAAACVAVVLAFTVLHVRFGAYPAAAGSAMLPIVLAAISRSATPALLQSGARLACLTGLLAAPILAPLAATAHETGRETAHEMDQGTGTETAPNPITAHACTPSGAYALLAAHPGAIVLAGVNETPDLLYHTPVRTVGSLYHRNPQGFMRLRAAWRSMPGDAPTPELLATGATLLLACPHEARSALLDGLPRETLLDRVIDGNPPAWLHRLADAGPGGSVLYEVVR